MHALNSHWSHIWLANHHEGDVDQLMDNYLQHMKMRLNLGTHCHLEHKFLFLFLAMNISASNSTFATLKFESNIKTRLPTKIIWNGIQMENTKWNK